MTRSISQKLTCAFALLAAGLVSMAGSVQADVINIDISQVDPSAIPVIRQAEAFWESRIQAYSREMPRAITDQLTSLSISATVAPIDGVGGILGFAGPDAVLSFGETDPLVPNVNRRRPWVVSVRSSMTFDLDDFPSMQADGILFDVIRHEMGHALGIGSLWELNQLIQPLGGVGLTQYTNGQYGIAGFRQGIGNPVASYVPLEQRGGPGTALGHWNDFPPYFNQVFTSAFTKELMTGFACDVDPTSGALLCAPKFVSEATWGSAADLGFAVKGINEYPAQRGNGTGRWPKVTGPTVDPFTANGVDPAAGLRFSIVTVKNVYRGSLGSVGSGADDLGTDNNDDPYNLRKHRWSK
jgi:hypothetical protein